MEVSEKCPKKLFNKMTITAQLLTFISEVTQ